MRIATVVYFTLIGLSMASADKSAADTATDEGTTSDTAVAGTVLSAQDAVGSRIDVLAESLAGATTPTSDEAAAPEVESKPVSAASRSPATLSADSSVQRHIHVPIDTPSTVQDQFVAETAEVGSSVGSNGGQQAHSALESRAERQAVSVNTTKFTASALGATGASPVSASVDSAPKTGPDVVSPTDVTTYLNLSIADQQSFGFQKEIVDLGDAAVEEDDTGNRTADAEDEADPRFMSFEEWKKQKVGNEAAQPQKKMKAQEGSRMPAKQINQNINGAIGEDMEINVEMFGGGLAEDEGGKLYKDRFNYASFDCAATIVKTNSEAQGASSILNDNKDSYLLNECAAPNKFVTIELCQDILVDTVMVGNYEFFSSTFKRVRLSVSDRFPIPLNGWKVLGEFDAENVRALQSFHVKNPLIWARYLRLEVLSHYGNEYYCPISVIRVHGQTMMDQFKNEEEVAAADDAPGSPESEIGVVSEKKEDNPVDQASDHVNVDDSSVKSSAEQHNTTLTKVATTSKAKATAYSSFDASIVDPERISTLNEECSVVLPHLGIEEFLQEIWSTDPGFCKEGEQSTQPPPVETREPITQESIYKNIMKRLSLLESNATLSLLYIEEQSRLLSSAFTKLEKRQTAKFDLLVSAFNVSVHEQVTHIKDLYMNLQQETNHLLRTQRSLHRDVLYDSTRQLKSISWELTFFRRLAMFNTVFIVCLLAYVVLTRETYIETEYIDDGDSELNFEAASSPGTQTPRDDLGISSADYVDSGAASPASHDNNSLSARAGHKKKKIKFSVSHKLGNGSASPVNTGNFYFDPNAAATGADSAQHALKPANNGIKKRGNTPKKTESDGSVSKESDEDAEGDESTELSVNSIN